MNKEPAADEDTPAEPKKRSKLLLALAAIVPLVLAGGGYVVWTQFFAGHGTVEVLAAAPAAGEAAHGVPDPVKVASVPLHIAAESSFTHSYALSVLIAPQCGTTTVDDLMAASADEALADGTLVNLSWTAAARRAAALGAKSCGHLMAEVDDANAKAMRVAAAKAEPEKGKKAAKGH